MEAVVAAALINAAAMVVVAIINAQRDVALAKRARPKRKERSRGKRKRS